MKTSPNVIPNPKGMKAVKQLVKPIDLPLSSWHTWSPALYLSMIFVNEPRNKKNDFLIP